MEPTSRLTGLLGNPECKYPITYRRVGGPGRAERSQPGCVVTLRLADGNTFQAFARWKRFSTCSCHVRSP